MRPKGQNKRKDDLIMAKGLRNAALLGGAALLAAKMMGGSKDKKKRMDEQEADAAMDVISRPDMSTTGDASAGMAKTSMDDFARKTQQDIDARIPVNPRMAGRATAAQNADAMAAAKSAAAFNRERAAYLNRGVGADQDADAMAAAKAAADFRSDRDAYLNKFSNRQAAAASKVNAARREQMGLKPYKKGGAVKASKSVSSASKRADGIATKGKTRGRMV
jgi:hypothetical protein